CTLAVLDGDERDYAKAQPMHQRTLAIREKAFGPEHPDVACSLNNLAMLYAAKGDISQAVTFQLRANEVSERNIALNLGAGSERQQLPYLGALSAQVDQTISLHVHYAPNDPIGRNM